ncbi:hypothetical protein PINS_up007592 [Pythium insidiosum]|nr:hypothetical protein PINS_up007592 [Pythium insidiosum]
MVFLSVHSVLTLASLAAVTVAAQEVKVSSFGFDGKTLSGAINVQNLAYQKVVNVIYSNSANKWGTTCGAVYTSGPDASNKELWSFTCPVNANGISQFFVEYKVNGQTYYDNNGGAGKNYVVPSPSTPTPTATTATPTGPPTPVPNAGFQADIDAYLASGGADVQAASAGQHQPQERSPCAARRHHRGDSVERQQLHLPLDPRCCAGHGCRQLVLQGWRRERRADVLGPRGVHQETPGAADAHGIRGSQVQRRRHGVQ